jgi:hypothetical protein
LRFFALDAAFESCVLFEHVQRYAIEPREVLRRMACPCSSRFSPKPRRAPNFVFDAQCWRITNFNRAASGLRLAMSYRNLVFGFARGLVVTLALDAH